MACSLRIVNCNLSLSWSGLQMLPQVANCPKHIVTRQIFVYVNNRPSKCVWFSSKCVNGWNYLKCATKVSQAVLIYWEAYGSHMQLSAKQTSVPVFSSTRKGNLVALDVHAVCRMSIIKEQADLFMSLSLFPSLSIGKWWRYLALFLVQAVDADPVHAPDKWPLRWFIGGRVLKIHWTIATWQETALVWQHGLSLSLLLLFLVFFFYI